MILNHGQVTWTTPELAPTLPTTTPHHGRTALDRFNMHRCIGFHWGNISNALLAQFRCNKSEFGGRLIAVDEPWIHWTGTKMQSKQWTTRGEPAPKKAKTVFSTRKVMPTVFWNSHRVILIEYLQKGKTITGTYYASLLKKLKAELAEKRSHLQKKKILFHQDNAQSHTSMVVMAKIYELRIELLEHLPYSQNLALGDFFLFPHLKIALRGHGFSLNEETITLVNNYFAKKNAEYYLGGLQKWKHRWEKCVELQGDLC
ncbi:mariner Mos1 transposase [Trichonephila clavipes]|uniref:Mariner Mos1 transposase n=1 Tax=Trichonephila clavipes TaxID=2585209 RepID=A0A8X6RKH9_TRICX|nr:mariner Mos1 transposase [Trichonephila clavipes]